MVDGVVGEGRRERGDVVDVVGLELIWERRTDATRELRGA